jgi:hypothetical protein
MAGHVFLDLNDTQLVLIPAEMRSCIQDHCFVEDLVFFILGVRVVQERNGCKALFAAWNKCFDESILPRLVFQLNSQVRPIERLHLERDILELNDVAESWVSCFVFNLVFYFFIDFYGFVLLWVVRDSKC